MKIMDTNLRIFLGTARGDSYPILNQAFKPSELVAMATLIAEAESRGRSYVTYEDYTATGLKNSYTPGANVGDKGAMYQVQTTLGQFNFEKQRSGSYLVTDTYNFNPIYGDTRERSQLALKATIAYMFGFRAGSFGYRAITGTDDPSFGVRGGSAKETAYNLARAYGEAYGPREDEGQGRPVQVFVSPVKR